MERQYIGSPGILQPTSGLEVTTSPDSHTRFDRERAHSYIESVARAAESVDETLRVADHCLISGLSAASRGELPAGAHLLTRSLVATALAAWQLTRIGEESSTSGDYASASACRADADRLIQLIPDHARLAVTALRQSPDGEAFVPEIRATIAALVFGHGIARAILNGARLLQWQQALSSAFDGSINAVSARNVVGLGLPRIAPAIDTTVRRSGLRPKLSAREREVLAQIVVGHTTSEVALRLGVKTTTVATLVGRIFNKLGVNNRAAAVAVALNQGLCTLNDEGHAQTT